MRFASTSLAALAVGLCASSSFAAFKFTTAASPTQNGQTRVDIYVLNDGTAVGTTIPAGTRKVDAIKILGEQSSPTTKFAFRYSTGGGGVDLYNNRGEPIDLQGDGSILVPNNWSALYLPPASFNNVYSDIVFSPAVTDSASGRSVTQFKVAVLANSATNAPDATAASNGGRGARFASLVVPNGSTFVLNGVIAAEIGNTVPFSVSYVPEPTLLGVLTCVAAAAIRRHRRN